ncbi:DUF1566 domain-containing protein [Sulfurovum sp. bin170]|uniref:Lcl C-terminal domain-containing protein n=1 Tax=Sulfurovum sp. bin170 TaxID=2695268 RepID=UPI0013E070FC|nr:DUF1566 domain-containing protein [Sulfurovum sp. bin170]NEW60011.1 DUF1566 domain-containing protein [Sulfurovum sp. bin170]
MKQIALILIGLSSLTWAELSSHNGIVKDSETKLEWQNSYRGEITELDWENAVSYCENLELDGGGWRLPSKSDLVSIISTKDSRPALDKLFLNKKPTRFDYWTSTVDKDEPNLRWGVNFNRGWTGRYTKHYGLKVRCVRGELTDNIPMAKTYGTVGKESKPFSDEKKGIIIILGEQSPSFRNSSE